MADGRHVVPGDTMSNEHEGWIYVHTRAARFVTWEEAKSLSQLLEEHEHERRMAQESAELEYDIKQAELAALLAPVQTFLRDHPAFAADLAAWHEQQPCVAWSEGQTCCIEILLAAPERAAHEQ